MCILLLQGLSNFCGWRNHLPRSTKLQEPLALLIKAKHSQGLPRNYLLFMDQIHKVIECTLGSGYANCEFWESTEIRVKPVRKKMNSKQHMFCNWRCTQQWWECNLAFSGMWQTTKESSLDWIQYKEGNVLGSKKGRKQERKGRNKDLGKNCMQ